MPLDPRDCVADATQILASTPRPVRILAAEDNPVNQQVLIAMLSQIGLEPTIVGNGLEVVQAWEDGDWDLILMDVQMPLMDGETATRAIRSREAELGRSPTPIIAVTANDMPHEMARYRAAGVNAIVSKPIAVDALYSAMIAAVASSDGQDIAAVAASAANTSPSFRVSSARR
jgi:CheY-like chemotaxis protein